MPNNSGTQEAEGEDHSLNKWLLGRYSSWFNWVQHPKCKKSCGCCSTFFCSPVGQCFLSVTTFALFGLFVWLVVLAVMADIAETGELVAAPCLVSNGIVINKGQFKYFVADGYNVNTKKTLLKPVTVPCFQAKFQVRFNNGAGNQSTDTMVPQYAVGNDCNYCVQTHAEAVQLVSKYNGYNGSCYRATTRSDVFLETKFWNVDEDEATSNYIVGVVFAILALVVVGIVISYWWYPVMTWILTCQPSKKSTGRAPPAADTESNFKELEDPVA